MTREPPLEDYLVALLDEIDRADRLRELVARAGYAKDDRAWILRSEVTAAVAALVDTDPRSQAFSRSLRQFLLGEGWRERRIGSGWQWRAALVKPTAERPGRRA